jgi:hypothetical protein
MGLLDTAAGRDDNGVRGREGIESALDAARNQPPTSAVSGPQMATSYHGSARSWSMPKTSHAAASSNSGVRR